MRHGAPTRAPLAATLLVLILAAAGCGTRVYTDFDAAADFAAMQRFAWLDPPLRETPRAEGGAVFDPFTHNTLLDQRVRAAVAAELEARGLREAAEDEAADFLLRYGVVSREVVRDSPVFVDSGYYGHRGYYGYGGGVVYTNTTTYQEGTLILDVIDPGTQRIAWRGWAASRTRDGHLDAERVESTVKAILAKFPPAPPSETPAATDETPEETPGS